MNDWRSIDWRSIFDVPIIGLVVREVEQRSWLVRVIELIAVAALTATVMLYASDARQTTQIQTLQENQKTLMEDHKELKAEVEVMRKDLYVPRSITNQEKIDEKHKK
jgi:DNA-directed RNA polymerase alpha subunit